MRARIPFRTVALAAALLVAGAAPALAKCSAASLKGEWRITGDWGEEILPDDSRNWFSPRVRCDVKVNEAGRVVESKCFPPLEYSIGTLTPKLRVTRKCEVSGAIVFKIDSHNRHYRSAEYSARVEGWIMESGDQMILMLHRREPRDDEVSEVTTLMAYRRP